MALELIGGALLSASLQFLFERIGSKEVLAYLRGKQNKSCDLEKLVGKLKEDLTLVMAVIEDAENKQRKSKSVEVWLDSLQDAVFDAEDLFDDIEYEAMRQTAITESSVGSSKKHNSLMKKLRNKWDKKWRKPDEEDEMEIKVKKVLEKFKGIVSQKDFLSLERGVVMEKASWRITTCLVDESQVFGRDSEKGEVIESLMSDDISNGKLSIVSIEGMGGLGKTTLAQLVFNESEVKEHFQVMVWVCVSEEFDVCKATKEILEGVTSGKCDVTGLNEIQVQLKERLTGKKFLIVLDDVWHEKVDDLDNLCLPFKHGAQGSKILVTTRNEKVSLNMRARAHNLQILSNEACWELFASQASGVNGDFTGNSDLETIGREIVKKCKGLPIALKTLGGLLRSTLSVGEWKRILESDIWDLTEKESNILPALKLSYHYLPSQLKRCFAYCSIFPLDYEFVKEDLVLLWMAENFLESPNKARRMEDVGDEYFNGLVSRSFFQRSKTNDSRFVMHDLLHDLAKFVSKQYCLLIEEDKKPSQVEVEKARHAGYMTTYINHYGRFNNILQSLNLRTFLSYGSRYGGNHISIRAVDELLLKLRCLRVLSLSGYTNLNLPESIGELSHLRSLDLSWTNISSLPESVCKLLNLQILKLYGCWSLTKLPKDMHHLIKLRYLDLRACSSLVGMPTQISKLKNLQILRTFIVGIDSGTKIGELRELSHLRREIYIEKLENVGNVKDSSDQARMMDKEHIETLKLYWSDDSNDDSQHAKDVLDMLMPNKALKELHVYGYIGKDFPNWIASEPLRNIVSIELWNCRNCLSLPPLGELPSLKSLDISDFDSLVSVGSEFYGDGCSAKPFPSLERLKFSGMKSWESWFNDNSGGFSMLTKLEVIDCNNLTGDLPLFLPSLTKLKINFCERLDFLQVESLQQMECCGSIKLSGLSSPMSIPIGCLPSTLKKLSVQYCSKLEFQFDSPHSSLEQLLIRSCFSTLRSFPLDFFPMLKEVDIAGLESLESLSISHGHLTSLNKLTISDCPKLVSFTQDGLPNSLTELKVSRCNKLVPSRKNWELKRLPNLRLIEINGSYDDVTESFPEEGLLPVSITCLKISSFWCLNSLDKNGLQQLNSLVKLEIWKLPKLQEIPGEALPNSLQDLEIVECDELQSISEEGFPTSLERFAIRACRKCQIKGLPASLKKLSIYGLTELEKMAKISLRNLDISSLQDFPSSLQELTIIGFNELQRMPDQVLRIPLQNLVIKDCPKLEIINDFQSSLQKLVISFCRNVNINNFPSSLQQLCISYCPLLEKKCKEEYENNIINIPFIMINGVRLIRTSDLEGMELKFSLRSLRIVYHRGKYQWKP